MLRPENPTYTYWSRGFTMVSFSEPSKHLYRRYMRSTESPSSLHVKIPKRNCRFAISILQHRCFIKRRLCPYNPAAGALFSSCPSHCLSTPHQHWLATLAVGTHNGRRQAPVHACESIPVQKWNSPHGGQVHYTDASVSESNDWGSFQLYSYYNILLQTAREN